MDRLPDEVIISVVLHLSLQDLVRCQQVSRRFKAICRDSGIWKTLCFDASPVERLRKRREFATIGNPQVEALRDAILGGQTRLDEQLYRRHARPSRSLARAIWDPEHHHEHLDFYSEYIHRHAPITAPEWLQLPRYAAGRDSLDVAAAGIGAHRHETGAIQCIYLPLEDGSVTAWKLSPDDDAQAFLLREAARSRPGLLTYGKTSALARSIMTDTGVVERVSIDSRLQRGYFAVQNSVQEIDLDTLQIISTQEYPFPVSVLSQESPQGRSLVGTTSTVHIYDARQTVHQPIELSDSCELINGATHSTIHLTQPGPLSMLLDRNSTFWLAGRFTHLLQYDLRYFGKLLSTVYSGARISCLSSFDYSPFPREADMDCDDLLNIRDYRNGNGPTIVAAGVYKGKGSLELFGLDSSSNKVHSKYFNRQTASGSKLLSVTPHSASLVTSDSDGNIKWFERNAEHAIRTYNINDIDSSPAAASSSHHHQRSRQEQRPRPQSPPSFNTLQTLAQTQLSHHSLVPDSFLPPDAADLPGAGDIVQKIIPLFATAGREAQHDSGARHAGSARQMQNPLLLWTGDGRVGVMGFGYRKPVVCARRTPDEDEQEQDAVAEDHGTHDDGEGCGSKDEALHVAARRAERLARQDAERQYAGVLRRALEGQANEARFMRGLGLG